ncbi:MAG TPA: hypothetical protein VHZ97_24930 [Pseudonocardiaceae bacterium]|jgi:hypothetical protein|nr:hypothetical protein [Pseudonocardiaceae bacterium]
MVHRVGNAPLALDRCEVELRMHPLAGQAPALRAMVAERAVRAGHGRDFIDDTGLAVDEVYAIALANCDPAGVLTVRLAIDAGRVDIDAWIPLHAKPIVDQVRLRVLRSLAESVDVSARKSVLRLSFCRLRPR